MNKIKTYFAKQASRPWLHLAGDFFVIGTLVVCVYIGWF